LVINRSKKLAEVIDTNLHQKWISEFVLECFGGPETSLLQIHSSLPSFAKEISTGSNGNIDPLLFNLLVLTET